MYLHLAYHQKYQNQSLVKRYESHHVYLFLSFLSLLLHLLPLLVFLHLLYLLIFLSCLFSFVFGKQFTGTILLFFRGVVPYTI